MERIKVKDKYFRPYITNAELLAGIDKVAQALNRDYASEKESPYILAVLNGALPFTAEIIKRLKFDFILTGMKVSSYSGMESTGEIVVNMDATKDLRGKKIIITEDIVDTGITVRELKKLLLERGAADVKVCAMLLKPDNLRRQLIKDGVLAADATEEDAMPYAPDYYSRMIGNEFIVGFGLDYDELGRGYEDIYVLDENQL